MTTIQQVVVVLGASPKAERFSNQAVRMLKVHGYKVIPIHSSVAMIEDLPVIKNLREVQAEVSTLSIYVGPERSVGLIEDILALHPARVVLNPGAESPALENALLAHGIHVVQDCTLRMLREARF